MIDWKTIIRGLAICAALAFVAVSINTAPDVADYPNPGRLGVYTQAALADSTGFAQPTSVAVTRKWVWNFARPRLTIVDGDTNWTKIVVPVLTAGDIITSVLRCDTGGGTAALTWLDISDSCYFSGDTIQPWVATDSSYILIQYNLSVD